MDNLLHGQTSLRAELRLLAPAESVLYPEDLLPPRVRLGLLTLNGGGDLLPRLRTIIQSESG
jgi:hypothetical protein